MTTKEATRAPQAQTVGMGDLVNRLTQELAHERRALAQATRKLATASRSLECRTQDLTEAKAALALLLATLDSTTDGIVAMGYFGRAMHFNSRFISIWGIAPDKLATLSDASLMAIQLSQVTDPARFLANAEARKANPDEPQQSIVELTDGRILECNVIAHRVNGKRAGSVMSYRDITELYRLKNPLKEPLKPARG
ncbi:PAS domain S-box protein [Caenimonas sp. SL110]|uniref:PAS domain S-box protein n=1 Tax=Caenimonas sp. SL110 TaxID=1450524 RepID=UPI000654753B|nr:PAS domain S-box protein [Caenimonas sp. SL110]